MFVCIVRTYILYCIHMYAYVHAFIHTYVRMYCTYVLYTGGWDQTCVLWWSSSSGHCTCIHVRTYNMCTYQCTYVHVPVVFFSWTHLHTYIRIFLVLPVSIKRPGGPKWPVQWDWVKASAEGDRAAEEASKVAQKTLCCKVWGKYLFMYVSTYVYAYMCALCIRMYVSFCVLCV